MTGPKRRALLVEDDPELRKLARRYLEKLEFDVEEVANGRHAIARLNEARPDLVCLDLMLPEQSGYEICEFIRHTPGLKDVPVLVVSARAMPEDRAHAEEVGADAYLIKPFSMKEFSDTVTRLASGVRR
jgi:two-component system chemotaxis response regulator CheY